MNFNHSIMGIWNVSPDSFSSHFEDHDVTGISHAAQLLKDGADILDIGAESTRPGSRPIDPSLERSRLLCPLQEARARFSCPISLDSRHPETIEWALDQGLVDIINDVALCEHVSQIREGRIYSAVRDCGAKIVLMAWFSEESKVDPFDRCMAKIRDQLERRIEYALSLGLDSGSLILDPGIGFGKGLDNDLRLMYEAPLALKDLGFPILIAHSRKRCIAKFASLHQELDLLTAFGAMIAFSRGADIVRVHAPKLCAKGRCLYPVDSSS